MATLEAKAVRSALRHSYMCFEFPELDMVDDSPTTAQLTPKEAADNASKVLEDVVNSMPSADKKEIPPSSDKKPVKKEPVEEINPDDIETVIRKEYTRLKTEAEANLVTLG